MEVHPITRQYLTAFAASFKGFSLGGTLAFSSPSGPILMNGSDPYIHLSEEQYGHFSSIMNLGSVIGSICSAPLMAFFGMRRTMILSAMIYLLGWSLITWGRTFSILLGARVLTGFGRGSSIACPVYIAEIASPSIRGKLCTSFELMISLGVLFNYSLPILTDSFRYMAVANMASPFLNLILLLSFCKESPVFLLSKNKIEEAKSTLVDFGGKDGMEKRFQDLKDFIEERRLHKKSIKSFMTDPVCRKPLLLTFCIAFIFNFSGITAVTFNLNQIFQSVSSNISETTSPIIVGAIQLVFNLVAGIFVDKWGRKVLLSASTFLMGMSIGCLGIYFFVLEHFPLESSYISWLPLIAACIYFSSYSFGLGPICWIIMSEVFPPDFKDEASSISIALLFVLNYVTTAIYVPLKEIIGLHGVFWAHGGFCFLSTFFALFILVETKGKTPQQIAELF